MLALYRAGRQADALASYQEARRVSGEHCHNAERSGSAPGVPHPVPIRAREGGEQKKSQLICALVSMCESIAYPSSSQRLKRSTTLTRTVLSVGTSRGTERAEVMRARHRAGE
jgi:hypothetical protein